MRTPREKLLDAQQLLLQTRSQLLTAEGSSDRIRLEFLEIEYMERCDAAEKEIVEAGSAKN